MRGKYIKTPSVTRPNLPPEGAHPWDEPLSEEGLLSKNTHELEEELERIEKVEPADSS